MTLLFPDTEGSTRLWQQDVTAADDPRPRRPALAEHDQFSPPGPSAEPSAAWPAARVVALAGADHVLPGRGGDVVPLPFEWPPVVPA